LVERFYNSVRNGDPLPIPYREILLTAHIMDEIFAQIYPAREQIAVAAHLLSDAKTGGIRHGEPLTSGIL
jgi:hypothetical protein